MIVTEFENNTTQQTQRTFARANLLRTFYGFAIRGTGVMDFGNTCHGEVATLLQICYGLVVYVAELVSDTMGKSPTCYGLATGKLM